MTTSLVRSAVLGLCVTLSACALPAARTTPSPERIAAEWTVVDAQAAQEAQAGRYDGAERLLLEFQQRYPGSAQAPEARFYRALYKLDPLNPGGSLREGVTLLDSTVGAPTNTPHRADAAVLRRLAMALDAKPAVVTVTAPAKEGAATPARVDTSVRDDEITKLREALGKANAELERVKRRLAAPKP
jgi:hypothetical protein